MKVTSDDERAKQAYFEQRNYARNLDVEASGFGVLGGDIAQPQKETLLDRTVCQSRELYLRLRGLEDRATTIRGSLIGDSGSEGAESGPGTPPGKLLAVQANLVDCFEVLERIDGVLSDIEGAV